MADRRCIFMLEFGKLTCSIETDVLIVSLMLFVSGGKDSCYNMMQCVQQGHEIVALANLKPRDGGMWERGATPEKGGDINPIPSPNCAQIPFPGLFFAPILVPFPLFCL